MIVSMWMTRDLVTIAPETPVSEAAALMARKRVRRLLVVQNQQNDTHLLGIVSATDILRAFPLDVNPFAVVPPDFRQAPHAVTEIMKRHVQTTTPETPVETAAVAMQGGEIGALPVLRAGKLVGIITESDIFRAFVSVFQTQGRGARITFDASKNEDVFDLIAQFARRDGVRVRSLISTLQEQQPVCVVRVEGPGVDEMLDDLWRSGHLVLNVLRFD